MNRQLSKRLWLNLLAYAAALASGFVLDWLSVPLSWLIGAMLAGGTIRLSGLPLPLFGPTRQTGQIVIGATVGLSFTHEAMAATAKLVGPMLAAGLLTIICAYLAALILKRLTRIDLLTASLASLPIGPVECATLALHYRIDPTPIIFAQCMRIVLLVSTLPPLVVALIGTAPDPSATLRSASWTISGSLLLLSLAVAAGFLAKATRFPNPFFNGPCAAGVAAMLLDLPVTQEPYPVLVAAQTMLGVWLGAAFDKRFFSDTIQTVVGILASSVALIMLCAASGYAMGRLINLNWQASLLSTAPGGVAEMALTAKILSESTAIVISFHLIRIFMIQLSAPILFRWISKLIHPKP